MSHTPLPRTTRLHTTHTISVFDFRVQGLTNWDFDVFSFAERTQGHPLITMTIALLELHNLLVGGVMPTVWCIRA